MPRDSETFTTFQGQPCINTPYRKLTPGDLFVAELPRTYPEEYRDDDKNYGVKVGLVVMFDGFEADEDGDRRIVAHELAHPEQVHRFTTGEFRRGYSSQIAAGYKSSQPRHSPESRHVPAIALHKQVGRLKNLHYEALELDYAVQGDWLLESLRRGKRTAWYHEGTLLHLNRKATPEAADMDEWWSVTMTDLYEDEIPIEDEAGNDVQTERLSKRQAESLAKNIMHERHRFNPHKYR